MDRWSYRNCWGDVFKGIKLKVGNLVTAIWFGDKMLGLVLEKVDSKRPGLEYSVGTWVIRLIDNGEKIHRHTNDLVIVNASG